MKELENLYSKKSRMMFPFNSKIKRQFQSLYYHYIPRRMQIAPSYYEKIRVAAVILGLISLVICWVVLFLNPKGQSIVLPVLIVAIIALIPLTYILFRRVQFRYYNFAFQERGAVQSRFDRIDEEIHELLSTITIQQLERQRSLNMWIITRLHNQYALCKSYGVNTYYTDTSQTKLFSLWKQLKSS